MISYIIIAAIVIILLAVSAWWFIRRKRKAKPAPTPEITQKAFNIIMNYVPSFINTYNGKDYVFLNITIENKTDHDLDDVVIEITPAVPIITDLRYRAISEKWNVNVNDPSFSDSLLSRVASIEPGASVSGYIVVETRNAHCNIDMVAISAGDQIQEIPVRKDRVSFKRPNTRRANG